MTERPVALITGVGRRIGIAAGIAAKLAADGWDIGFCHLPEVDARFGVDGSEAEAIAEELRGLGARVSRRAVDLGDPEVPAQLVAVVTAELGAPTALVLSHAESVDSDIFTTSVEAFDRHHAVNARAAWLLIREFALGIPARTGAAGESDDLGAGAIVALTSPHVAHNLAYGASKGSLDRIVVGAATELAPRGIRANIVNPGPIDTGWMDDAIRASGITAQPTGRFGRPSDTAELVSFLVSPASAWITGQTIFSDGGFAL
ncbi:SDR family oxidoreductase [Schumannella luteola]|uniref:3-oxoacyl-[acyl-carrier protein] reductase n=1 Tax=Schumannella luteola TaxID=472059 RepID=A0A852YIA3_9MICO|nr:SDR family oxidoreductase [Schumannella luteola]NYG98828.1 3-oxoacyl-[acyl-carrier protein] reductase [Schumannella luteola]TPX01912.1 SDR family oxidoreductase [Schumannella luteola]